jgi:ABC-type uncharacterized transport system substrate-binding protein
MLLQSVHAMSQRLYHSLDWYHPARLCQRVLIFVAAIFAVFSAVHAQESARRILHVDSYHQGNEWNDRIVAALQEALKDRNIELRVFHMDTKRRPSHEDIQAAVLNVGRVIEEFKPHVITTSDDPAAQYLIMPHLRDSSIPVVFCGLNWDASAYDLPYRNTTGMVEVSSIPADRSTDAPECSWSSSWFSLRGHGHKAQGTRLSQTSFRNFL